MVSPASIKLTSRTWVGEILMTASTNVEVVVGGGQPPGMVMLLKLWPSPSPLRGWLRPGKPETEVLQTNYIRLTNSYIQ
nr:MAG: hypothetical protein H3Bulk412432_000003 [Mitovirus sp.]